MNASILRVVEKAESLAPVLTRLLNITGQKVLVDIKTPESIARKCAQKGIQPEQLSDVLRAAVLVHRKHSVDKVVGRLIKHARKHVMKVDYKERTSNNPYHGAVHLDLNLDGMSVEVQVMPQFLWAYKEEAHKEYEKLRCGKLESKPTDWFSIAFRVDKGARIHISLKTNNRNKSWEIL